MGADPNRLASVPWRNHPANAEYLKKLPMKGEPKTDRRENTEKNAPARGWSQEDADTEEGGPTLK